MTAPSAAPDRASFFASLRLIFGPLTAAKVRSVDRAIDALLGVAPESALMASVNSSVRALQQYVRQSGPVPVNTRAM